MEREKNARVSSTQRSGRARVDESEITARPRNVSGTPAGQKQDCNTHRFAVKITGHLAFERSVLRVDTKFVSCSNTSSASSKRIKLNDFADDASFDPTALDCATNNEGWGKRKGGQREDGERRVPATCERAWKREDGERS